MTTRDEIDQLNLRAHSLYREKSAESHALATQAFTLAGRIDYPYGQLNALFNQGRALTLQGAYHDAIALFAEALPRAEEQGLPALIAELLQEIARAHFTVAEYDKALQYWSRCLDVSHSAQVHDAWLRALIGLGQIYNAHGDFQSALAHHRWALNSWKEGDDPGLYVSAAINVGVDLYQLRRLDEALAILHQTRCTNNDQKAEIHSILGLIHLTKGQLNEAEQALKTALDTNHAQGNALGYATNLLSLGRLAMARKDLDAAQQLLAQAMDKANSMGTPHLLLQIELALAESHEIRGQWQQALHHFKRYHAQQQLASQVSPHRIQAMEMQLEIERARMENVQLRRKHASERQERRRVERMASEDTLTGLLNRRGLEQSADSLLLSDTPVSALMIDVDHFKSINDNWGHEIGDKALRQVGALLKSGCRQGDLVARWGGEEFAVLLQNRDGPSATDVARRLGKMVQEWGWSRITPGLRVTVSIGVAEYQPANDDLMLLLSRADKRLYHAKHSGRNCVSL